jgi:glycosyltransferase involved in cell wall biosynthesis
VKVLFLTHAFPRDRHDLAGSFILRLAVALRERGVVVEVLAPSEPGLRRSDEIDGIPVSRFRYAPGAMETLAYTGTMAEQVRASWSGRIALAGMLGGGVVAALRRARSGRPALIHAHWWFPAGLVANVASQIVGVPYVVTMHGSDVRLARGIGAARRPMSRVLAGAAATTAVSTWLAREAEAVTGRGGIAVEPMPVNVSGFTAAGRPVPGRLLFVGRLNEQKGIESAVRTLALLPAAITLDVVGDGEREGDARRIATEIGVASRINWHGRKPPAELAAFYHDAEAVLMPSEEEGLGLVAVEAALTETPVVAIDSGGVTDIVVEGVTGALAAERSPSDLAAAVQRVLGRPDRGSSLGIEGRKRALSRFAPGAVADRYLRIYMDAIAAHAS